jgi:hypothetical protein
MAVSSQLSVKKAVSGQLSAKKEKKKLTSEISL